MMGFLGGPLEDGLVAASSFLTRQKLSQVTARSQIWRIRRGNVTALQRRGLADVKPLCDESGVVGVEFVVGGCPRLGHALDQGRSGVTSSWCRQNWRPSVLTLLDAQRRHRQGTPREVARKFVVGGCPRLVLDLPSLRS